jgi:hypothetical protein
MTGSRKLRTIDRMLFTGLFVFVLALALHKHAWNPTLVIHSDPEGYYMYLPAVFVYGGIHHLPDKDFVGRRINDKGESYTKFTCGVALFYLPFFLVAHGISSAMHLSPPGFSPPYAYALVLCGVIWTFIGLWFLKRLLLRYFSLPVIWITLLCLFFGTNFYHYATWDVAHSHVYNFALTAIILYILDGYYKEPSRSKVAVMAFFFGWLVLSRPTNIALLPFLLLYGVTTIADARQRLTFIKRHRPHLLLAVLFFLITFIPQLIYWKQMTGSWVKYSYGHETFAYWLHPKIAAVLFDTQNGLFIYSPILVVFVIGLIIGRKDHRTNFAGVTTVALLITYLFAGWWAWWFGGAFGERCYIDFFPMLAFPFAVAVEYILGKGSVAKYAFAAFALICSLYCVRMSALYIDSGPWDGPKWEWNWAGWWQLTKQALPTKKL